MKKTKLSAFLGVVLAVALATACSSDKKAQEGEVANQDIGNAVELTFPETRVAQANTGYGNVLEISSDNPADHMYFSKEENSEWYYFKATESGSLGMVIKPEEGGKDYNWVIFKKTGSDFAKEVVERKIMPLRSNLSKAAEGAFDSTGLGCTAESEFEGSEGTTPYSKPLDVEKDSVYYLCVNHTHAGGTGYNIRLFYCGAGMNEGAATADTATVDTAAAIAPAPETLPQPETLPSKPAPTAKARPKARAHANLGPLGPDEEYYFVKPGNTVYSISTGRGMKVMELLSRNRLTNNNIFLGQRLIVKKLGAYRNDEPQDNVATATPAPKAPTAAAPKPAPAQPAAPAPAPAPKEANNVVQEAQAQPAQPKPTEPEEIVPTTTGVRASPKPVASGTPAAPNSLEGTNAVPEALKKLWVYVNVVNAKNNNPINTIVQVVDGKNTKRVDKVASNQLAYVPIYADANRKKIFVIDAFSFRKESFELDMDNLRNDSSANQLALVNDTIVLNFELERYKKKDIFAAYNIFFYDDASVMLPKSKYELESLLEMLKENPRTQIRIHGHTNSSSMGKIISLEPGDHDFFRLTAKNKESFGTAVMLSKRRAESIKYYLEYHGVKGNRLEIKGWGGRKMIYERDASLAHKNKRVEIEILED